MKRIVAAGSVLLALGATSGFAQVVTSPDDPDPSVDGTLRFEIDNASAGDVIDVQVGAPDTVEPISLRETLVFTQDLEIDNSSTDTAVIDVLAPAGSAFLEIQDGVDVTLRDVGLSGLDSTSGDDIELGTGSLLTIDSERAQQVLTMDIVGLGALRKEGIQQIQLTGINTFSGGFTIDDGDVVGEVRSLGAGTIDLAPDASSKTARLVFESSGTDTLGATGPAITDSRSSGGNAGIVKRGSGTLVVTNATIASSLDFDIEEGTLRVGATQLSNSHDFDVGPTATLELDAVAGTVASSSVLTGTGTIDVEADALTFTADPSGFTGTFDVKDGPGAGAGALVLDIAATPSASLRFDATADGATFTLRDAVGVRWSGDFSGTGVFVKAGAGTTTLTGTHSQTGETRVLAGTLVGNTSNLPGDIALAGGAAVVFDQASNATYADTIRNFSAGTHTVRKLGGGVLSLADDQTFTGTFEAVRGGLHFGHGADLTGAGLTVGNGSSGVVTNLTADFDPTGTLDNTVSINGPVTFSSDSRVTVGVSSADSPGDPLRNTVFAATGAVDIQPGAVLAIETTTGNPTAGDQWDVVTGSSVTGDFDVEQTLFFFSIADSIVGGNTVRLTLVPSGASLETEATTSNGRVIGAQLDAFLVPDLGPASRETEYQQAIRAIGAAEVDELLSSVSPDDLSAGTQIQLANAQRTWRGISDRLALRRIGGVGREEGSRRPRRTRPSVSASPRSNAAGRDEERAPREEADWQAWIEASGLFGELSSNEAREYDYVSAGPLVGADRALGEQARVGFALSGGGYSYETNQGGNEGDGGGVEGTVYGAYVGEPVEVLVGARAGWSRIDTERTLSVGSISDRVDGELEGEVYGVFVELTRGFDLPGAVEIAPLASLAWTGVRWDAFDESGSSPLAVRVDEQELDSVLTSLGVRLQGERRMDENIWFRPRFRALWSREWGGTEREVSGAFASAPGAGLGAFTVEGAEGPTDLGEIALGWDVGFTTNANLFFDWRGRFGDDLVENTISAGGRIVW